MKKQIYYDYLEKLRLFGKINLFGATPYLQRKFGLEYYEAVKILGEWMTTYKKPE